MKFHQEWLQKKFFLGFLYSGPETLSSIFLGDYFFGIFGGLEGLE